MNGKHLCARGSSAAGRLLVALTTPVLLLAGIACAAAAPKADLVSLAGP